MRTLLLVPIFFLHLQFLFSNGNGFETHPLAIPYLQEAYILLTLLSAIAVFVKEFGSGQFRYEYITIPIVFGYMISSACLSEIAYGQPLFYGLFEERRALLWLSAIPFSYISRRFKLSVYEVLQALVICSALYLIVSLTIQVGLSEALLARQIGELDTRKLRIINGSEVYIIVLLTAPWTARYSLKTSALGLVFGVSGLLLISQTRSVLVEVFCSQLLLLVMLKRRFVKWGLLGALVLTVLVLTISNVNEFDVVNWLWNLIPNPDEFASTNLSSNVRVSTITSALDSLRQNGYVGMGALSQQWHQGYLRLYGPNFFITDIGVIGEFYRLGWLIFPFIFLMFWLQAALIESCKTEAARLIALSLFLFYILSAPLNGILWHGGQTFALIAMLAYCRSWSSDVSVLP